MAIDETVSGDNSIAIKGTATGAETVGVRGKGDAHGVQGEGGAVGVHGTGIGWHGVVGVSSSTTGGVGVFGHHSGGGTGVVGESSTWMGVYGKSNSTTGGAGVMGEGDPGPGVIGKSSKWIGVYGETAGLENGPAGVWGEHKGAGIGVKAVSKDGAGLAAYSETGHAGFFEGHVWVSRDLGVGGDITLANADCAEDFDIANQEPVEPGTVMVLGEEGALRQSAGPYDKRVAGIISGAGDYKPGIILDRQPAGTQRQSVALLGKVFCKVDASYAPIEPGDLLTTSPTAGHAMKASDQDKAFGAVIGKALRALTHGRGLIPVLVALQ